MFDFLRWVIALEILGLAALPLTTWAFRSFPDRGYAFAKPLALLLVTYVTWIIGSFLPVARAPILPALVALTLAAAGWWFWRTPSIAALREARRPILIEEGLFLGGMLVLSLLRVYTFGSGISHTEQFMDMALMNASLHSASYPPFDPWMSGQTINYYYFGYLVVATLTKLAGVLPAVGYNLALSTIFAVILAGAYSVAYAFMRKLWWPLLAPVALAVIGNWHWLLWNLAHGHSCPNDTSTFWGTIWESTRVIGGGFTLANWAQGPPWTHSAQCGVPTNTIDEYPLFSFILGDMHPHVMSLPFTLLAVGLAIAALRDTVPMVISRSAPAMGRLLLLGVAVGSLFAINSWDFPTYFVLAAGCLTARFYLADDSPDWWRQPLLTTIVLGVVSVVLFAPFYLHFSSPAHGIGRVTTPSDIYEFLQVFGLFLLAGGVLLFSLSALLQPSTEEEETEPTGEPVLAAEGGQLRLDLGGNAGILGTILLIAFVLIAAALHLIVLLLLLGGIVLSLTLLHRVLNTEEPNLGDAGALILLAVACAVIALPEVIYLRDAFDGSAEYRMNTVFKFYYQGWTLLAVPAAYSAYRSWHIIRSLYRPAYAWVVAAVLAIGLLGAGQYTALAFSAQPGDTSSTSLDGAGWMKTTNPADVAAIAWLRNHAPDDSVVLEAVGDDYVAPAARISTFSGFPTVMGWIGHEQQWRGNLPAIQNRAADVATIYTTTDIARAKSLLQQYNVRYVVVGDFERSKYAKTPSSLTKFSRFMRPVYQHGSTTIYTW